MAASVPSVLASSRRLAPGFHDVNLSGSCRTCRLQHQQTDGAAADHHRSLAEREAAASHGPDSNLGRLDEGTVVVC